MQRPALACLVLALAAGPGAHAQTLYKCVGRDGKVVYQDEKCGEDRRQSTVAPPPPPALPSLPEGSPGGPEVAGGASIDMETLVSVISNVENCIATVPGFSARHGAAFQKWKARHGPAMVRFNQDARAQLRVRQSREYVTGVARDESPEQRAWRAENCDKAVAASIDSVPTQTR